MKICYEKCDIDILISKHYQQTIDYIMLSENDYAYLYDEFRAKNAIVKEDDYWFKTTYGFTVHLDTFQEDYYTN